MAGRPGSRAGCGHVVALDAGRGVESGPAATLRHADGPLARLATQADRARSWRITATPPP